ncbi:MAG: SAM-dependent methyltransferase [Xanthomonadales bacterium]|nr:SAM-dependent methyltransferase [Xanthomonadales bacterium]
MSAKAPAVEYGQADQDWSAADYARHAGFVVERAADLIDWLAPRPGERVLDLGCGDGTMSLRLLARDTAAIGVDASPAMVAAALEQGIEAMVLDGHDLADGTAGTDYDAVFSNAALHWMKQDPDAVIAGVRTALCPGGRFVAEFGGAGNVAPIRAALRAEAEERGRDADTLDPWFFPDAAEYRARLEEAGFVVERLETFERPTPLPGDIADWLTTLAWPFVTAFAAGPERNGYVSDVVERLRPELADANGHWYAPYLRLRFIARKPEQD